MFIVYKTTNSVNGKYYIGIHKIGGSPKTKNYLGSGKLLKAAVKKYGEESFTRETLHEGLDEETAKSIEAQLVDANRLKDPECYNLTLGGGYPPSWKGIPKSTEQKEKMSEAAKKSWAKGTRVQHTQSEDFKQNMRLNNPSRDPRVRGIQSQGRKAYFAKMTTEERTAYANRCAATRKKNKEMKAQNVQA